MSTENKGPLDGVSLGDILKIVGMAAALAGGWFMMKGATERNAEIIMELKKHNEKQDTLISNNASKMAGIENTLTGQGRDVSHIRETLDELKPHILKGINR